MVPVWACVGVCVCVCVYVPALCVCVLLSLLLWSHVIEQFGYVIKKIERFFSIVTAPEHSVTLENNRPVAFKVRGRAVRII